MKILNIDNLVRPKRSITLGGVDHPILELGVQEFIDNLAAAEALEKAEVEAKLDNADISAAETLRTHIDHSIAAIKVSIPTVDIEVVRKLPITAIGAIMQHIRGELDEQALQASQEDGTAKK